MITFFDIAIIYLACGTPFGVYFYIQNRTEKSGFPLLSGVVFHTLFWIALGIKYLHRSITKGLPIFKFDDKSSADSVKLSKIEGVKKSLESSFIENKSGISLFDFRGILERYCGLTLEVKEIRETAADLEIFKLSDHPDSALASRCVQRRNLAHLERHQRHAGKDLLTVLGQADSAGARESLRKDALELAMLLEDGRFETDLRELYRLQTQMEHKHPVKELENEVWISRQQPSKQTAALKTISATASLSKD